jgi:hypothetical protein
MASIEHTNSPAPGYTPEAVPTTAPAASDEEIRAIVSAFEAHDFGSDDEFRVCGPRWRVLTTTIGRDAGDHEVCARAWIERCGH